jgi:hypothetical protein
MNVAAALVGGNKLGGWAATKRAIALYEEMAA